MLQFIFFHNPTGTSRCCSSTAAIASMLFWIARLNALDSHENRFESSILPVLKTYCLDCHSGDSKEGGVQFNLENPQELLTDKAFWLKVLKNVRAEMMPPRDVERPNKNEKQLLMDWIHSEVFKVQVDDPFPGVSPIRRLNRREYRNTIRDLMGVDFNAEVVFPPDDTGFGFDNVSEAMSLSPMLIEKYLQSAKTITTEAVPKTTWIMPSMTWRGKEFTSAEGSENGTGMRHNRPQTARKSFSIKHAGEYRITLREKLDGSFEFNPGRYRIDCTMDDKPLYSADHKWEEDKFVDNVFQMNLLPGSHAISVQLSTLKEGDNEEVDAKDRFVSYEIVSLTVDGPLDESLWKHPNDYARFFHLDAPPSDTIERRQYAQEIIERFATKAFRRPPSDLTCQRLVTIAESIYLQPGASFESGIEKAMMAILASSEFLFRVEDSETLDELSQYPMVDQYALASRLSYFLWSTMPDQELLDLASEGELRSQLGAQVERMIRDNRSGEFVESFAGQWLRARDVENVSIDPIAAMGLQKEYASLRERFSSFFRRTKDEEAKDDEETAKGVARMKEIRDLRDRFDATTRTAMRKETEMSFDFIVREDKSLLDLIDADYVFVNEKLATLYGIEGVEGREMQRVSLPAESPRGGVLTQGTMLAVTSNPTRTSPVKRGLFILDNILGTPSPPAPPNVPELEAAADRFGGREPSLRELLAVHREAALCSSCHSRMDPLGLALENFNAIGSWRDTEAGQSVDSAGELITGEKFKDIRELKRILKTDRRRDFYRCVTEKLFIYALGRGLEYYDEIAVDKVVDQLDQNEGRFSVLLQGVVNSAAFQRRYAPN